MKVSTTCTQVPCEPLALTARALLPLPWHWALLRSRDYRALPALAWLPGIACAPVSPGDCSRSRDTGHWSRSRESRTLHPLSRLPALLSLPWLPGIALAPVTTRHCSRSSDWTLMALPWLSSICIAPVSIWLLLLPWILGIALFHDSRELFSLPRVLHITPPVTPWYCSHSSLSHCSLCVTSWHCSHSWNCQAFLPRPVLPLHCSLFLDSRALLPLPWFPVIAFPVLFQNLPSIAPSNRTTEHLSLPCFTGIPIPWVSHIASLPCLPSTILYTQLR